MASTQRNKPSKSFFEGEDILDDLLGDNDYLTKGTPARGGAKNRSSTSDDFFQKLAEEAERDVGNIEDSDVSDADPNDILKDMKDMDDMDADLFGSQKKPSSAPPQVKPAGAPRGDPPTSESRLRAGAAALSSPEERKPSSAPASTTRSHKKFTFSNLDDPLADLLADESDRTKAEAAAGFPAVPPQNPESGSSPPPTRTSQTAPAKAPKKRGELTFDDEEDDLVDALGFDTEKDHVKTKADLFRPKKESGDPPQRARSRLDEILQRGTSPRLLERPPTGEKKDPPPALDKSSAPKEQGLGDDLTFGSYHPTLGSSPEGRPSRRQSVRFSTENISSPAPEQRPKPDPPSQSPARPRAQADWLGLKTEDPLDYLEEGVHEPRTPPAAGHGAAAAPPHSPGRPEPTAADKQQKKEEEEEEEEDWLAGALSRRKTPPSARSGGRRAGREEGSGVGEEPELDAPLSKSVPSPVSRRRPQDSRETGQGPGQHTSPQAPPTTPQDQRGKRVAQQSQSQSLAPPPQQQVSLSADGLQHLLLQQQLIQSQLLGLGGPVDVGALQRAKDQQPGDLQARIVQLEGQVKSVQLERDQIQMLLDSVQLHHKQDTELMENTHRARVKLLEESAAQREARSRQECEDLLERLATVTRQAEQERTELQAQHQRRQNQAQLDRDCEVERLRDLQRKSILEMKKDHEEQIHRLKRLKDEEIDAVTSATSQTRSLTVVIEQMETFSQRLGDLSTRVESTHEHTAQGLEQGARQRDEQLRVMQDRLGQQQRAMAEERARLKEVIARMDTQVAEQQRQLEKERWRVTAEQAKAESSQRALEEERRSLTMHLTVEREELERAKTALLEEQQQVMARCAEERRKLAAEWSNFHSQEKQRRDRDAQREGSVISLAQEQAEARVRAGELRQKEEALGRQREEMEQEKERLNSTALRLKTRAQEVEALSKLATQRYEEGERALEKAQQLEAGHQERLASIHVQMERVRQQQHLLHQERIRMNDVRRDIERLRQGLPVQPLPVPPLPQTVPPAFTDLSLLAGPPHPLPALGVPPSLCTPGSTELQAKLSLLKHTAEKDRDYLEDEQLFLDTLKKAAYNSAFHTE